MPLVDLLYVVAVIVTSATSMCTNATLLLVLALNRSLRTETWPFSLSSCLSDLALSLGAAPFGAHNGLVRAQDYASDSPLCHAAGFALVLFQLASLHSLTWATADRFAEICFAMRYPNLFTKQRAWGVLALLWLYCLANAALPLLGFGSYSYSAGRFLCTPSFKSSSTSFSLLFIGLGIGAPVLITCSLYAYLVYVARNQALRGTFICNEQHCYYVPAQNYFRSSIVMVATVVYLLLCWLPYISTCFYEVFTGQDCPTEVNAVATWLVLLTSALNPWISSMTQKKYREALGESSKKLRLRFLPPPKNTLPCHIRSQPPTVARAPCQEEPAAPAAPTDALPRINSDPSSPRTPSPIKQTLTQLKATRSRQEALPAGSLESSQCSIVTHTPPKVQS